MAGVTDSDDIRRIIWSARGYPIDELIPNFSLPILVKSANSSKGHGSYSGIVAHQIYRIKRLLRVHAIKTRLMSSSKSDVSAPLEIRIPKDYRGPFQIIPVESSMYIDISLEDVVKYRPRYIKVVTKVSNITTGVHIDLNAGDDLEVLGTRNRATKTGVKEYLKLRKDYREFILNPDCEGMFRVIEDSTLYTLCDILDKFPLPQKVSLVNTESHSDVLLTLLPSRESGGTTLMLKEEVQDDYVIGEDLQKQIRTVLHSHAEMYFYVPDSISPASYVEIEQFRITPKNIDGDELDDEHILIDQLICLSKDKPVICGAAGKVFTKLALHPRSATSHANESPQNSMCSLSDPSQEVCYVNVAFHPAISRDEQYGKVGVGLPMCNDMPDCPRPIPPKPQDGQGDRRNVKLMTAEETRNAFADKNSRRWSECVCEQLYDDLRAENAENDIEDDETDYELVPCGGDDVMWCRPCSNYYEIISDDNEDTLSTNVSTEDKNQMEDEKSNDESNEYGYENTLRAHNRQIKLAKPPPLPQAITHHSNSRTEADNHTEKHNVKPHGIPPELPPPIIK
ncbi:uncharacterized protein [Amphiura filiformis]|uniref:uncharacterized protein n=1 Tax=Amphiura filiformis TaxID=82378 RepID=UPI003B20E325